MNNTRHSSGTVEVHVQRRDQEDPTPWETYYELEEYGGGDEDASSVTLIVERPPFEDATDLHADVIDALYAAGWPTISVIHWI